MAEKEVKLFSNTFMAATFALLNFVLVLLLMWTVQKEYAPEWKTYQHEYYRLLAAKADDPALKEKILSTPLEIQQIWNPKTELTDRCMTCHLGVSNPKMTDVPQPFAVHPDHDKHNFMQIGCTVCHEGQGVATTKHDAHVMHDLNGRFGPFDEQHIGWSRPLLPLEYVQASCNKCHNVLEAPVPGADHLNKGWELVQEKGCKTCHYIVDSGAKQAPELSTTGTKFYNASGYSEAFFPLRFGYLKESLRCPQANMNPEAAKACKATLTETKGLGNGQVLSASDLLTKYQCASCHSLNDPGKLIGPSLYDIGQRQPEAYVRESILEPDKVVAEGFAPGLMRGTLAGVGFYEDIKKTPAIVDTLVSHLMSLKGGAQASGGTAAAAVLNMPNFNFNDEELRNVVTFLLSLQEPSVSWPKKSFADKAGASDQTATTSNAIPGDKSGEELLKIAACNTCHKVDGPERLVGPSLWDIGTRQDKAYIRESILEPDKVVVEGYPGQVMKTTLDGLGFYQRISVESLEKLVDYLASLKGK